ncbi:MAG: LysR family transcriptional regulator [Lautropia sp.]|nr:LysR family transcriptional regulator [Lautropia sp.]
MDTLQSMQVFCQVVARGSFTRAAEALNISTAMASKHVRHLEEHVQARLLNRSSRRQSLTEAGAGYYQQCQLALSTLDEARECAQAGTVSPQGLLKLTMPAWCATSRLARILADYRAVYPQVTLSLHLDSRHSDLVAHGIDLALRVTSRPEPNLIVRPLAKIRFDWVATPSWLQHHGVPSSPADLRQRPTLLPDYVSMSIDAPLAAESNSLLMLHQLALADAGLARLPEWITADDLQSGRLVRVPTAGEPDELTLYAAYLERAWLSAKVRSLIDFLAEHSSGRLNMVTDQTAPSRFTESVV